MRPRGMPLVEAEVVESAQDSALPAVPEPVVVLDTPEPGFASRVPEPEPDRPLAAARRAIFFDVENASRPEHIARVIDHLAVDRMGRRTDFVAVGNWRVIGHDTARLLARHGAQLVHSAPSTGVRDWSDLRIAVAAGVWLASARPGDVMEIVTSDRAFDAVGDVAASLGIAFRRLSHQGLAGTAGETLAPVREPAVDARSHRRGRGRRRSGWRDRSPMTSHEPAPARHHAAPVAEPPAAPPIAAAAPVTAPVPPEVPEPPPHTAPHDEIIAVVRDLMERSPGRAVTLDTLANALKSRGFSRPPGSPRLITRLRRIKEISLSRSGVITLLGAGEAPASSEAPTAVEPEVGAEGGEAAEVEAPAVDRAEAVPVERVDVEGDEADEGPGPGNEALPATEPSQALSARRRRPWRGGRGRRRSSEAARAL